MDFAFMFSQLWLFLLLEHTSYSAAHYSDNVNIEGLRKRPPSLEVPVNAKTQWQDFLAIPHNFDRKQGVNQKVRYHQHGNGGDRRPNPADRAWQSLQLSSRKKFYYMAPGSQAGQGPMAVMPAKVAIGAKEITITPPVVIPLDIGDHNVRPADNSTAPLLVEHRVGAIDVYRTTDQQIAIDNGDNSIKPLLPESHPGAFHGLIENAGLGFPIIDPDAIDADDPDVQAVIESPRRPVHYGRNQKGGHHPLDQGVSSAKLRKLVLPEEQQGYPKEHQVLTAHQFPEGRQDFLKEHRGFQNERQPSPEKGQEFLVEHRGISKEHQDFLKERKGFHHEGQDFQQEGQDFQQEGQDFQQEGQDFQQEGQDFQQEGQDFQQEGQDFQQKGQDYQQKGQDYQQKGQDYQQKGQDYQQEGHGFQQEGQDFQQEGQDIPTERQDLPKGRQEISNKRLRFLKERQDNNKKMHQYFPSEHREFPELHQDFPEEQQDTPNRQEQQDYPNEYQEFPTKPFVHGFNSKKHTIFSKPSQDIEYNIQNEDLVFPKKHWPFPDAYKSRLKNASGHLDLPWGSSLEDHLQNLHNWVRQGYGIDAAKAPEAGSMLNGVPQGIAKMISNKQPPLPIMPNPEVVRNFPGNLEEVQWPVPITTTPEPDYTIDAPPGATIKNFPEPRTPFPMTIIGKPIWPINIRVPAKGTNVKQANGHLLEWSPRTTTAKTKWSTAGVAAKYVKTALKSKTVHAEKKRSSHLALAYTRTTPLPFPVLGPRMWDNIWRIWPLAKDEQRQKTTESSTKALLKVEKNETMDRGAGDWAKGSNQTDLDDYNACFTSGRYITSLEWIDFFHKDNKLIAMAVIAIALFLLTFITTICIIRIYHRQKHSCHCVNLDFHCRLADVQMAVFHLSYSQREKLSKLMYDKLIEDGLTHLSRYFDGIGKQFAKQMDFNLLFDDLAPTFNLHNLTEVNRSQNATPAVQNIDLNDGLEHFLYG